MSETSIGTVGPEYAPRIRHLMDLAFDDPRPFDPAEPAFDEGRVVGAFRGDELLGTVMTHEFAQVFGGKPVRCGGVAGVTVAPHARNQNLGRRMLTETFTRMRDRGEAISSLYPTTSLLYRGVGYGVAGEFAHRTVPFDAIGPAEALDWAECEFGCEAMRRVHRTESSRHDGWILPSDEWWDHQSWRRSGQPSERVFSWIGRRAGEPVAAVVYTYGKSDRTLYDIKAQLLAGIDLAAVRSSLAFLATNGSTAERLDTTVPGPILDIALDRPELATSVNDWPWMLRLVDLGGAIGARGYPSSLSLSLDLAVTDSVIAANSGPWRLSVNAGKGSIEPGGNATVAADIGDLARVYAGADPRLVHDDGGLAGITHDDLETLATVFAARVTLPIFF